MAIKAPGVGAVMTGVLGLFMVTAACGTAIPGFVHDRVPRQFIPVCTWLLSAIVDKPAESLVKAAAVTCQVIIALVELTAGVVMLAAAAMPRRRRALTNFGVALTMGLFGAFMLTMFAMHDKSLPAWNQYPAIFAWLAGTWLVVALTDAPTAER